METLLSASDTGTSSAREAGRRLDLPPSSMRNILHGVLNQYPYKLQSCHELLQSDTVEREAFARKKRGTFISSERGGHLCVCDFRVSINYPPNVERAVWAVTLPCC
ncbi:hypothetical protein NPIL_380901 [Nephila pilipes]|uniref:Uncharacterized protein n=1 Tax=Nephila pilipes TaxID=299642 RepID=A0A8X6MDB6_NEPPI|nr:hypothetical protein NPIL_380901 [Nephila pilipes]